MPVKALVDRIINWPGEEFRLVAGEEAPQMPGELVKVLQAQGYLEKPDDAKALEGSEVADGSTAPDQKRLPQGSRRGSGNKPER